MGRQNILVTGVFSVLAFMASSAAIAASEFAQDVTWTNEKMQEFVDLDNKGTITTGFFDCMVQHVKNRPYEYCLPPEVKFQDSVVNDLAKQRYQELKGPKQTAFAKQQQDFINYRLSQCSWTDDPRLVSNPKTMTADTKSKLKCLLNATITRRLQLEAMMPQNNE